MAMNSGDKFFDGRLRLWCRLQEVINSRIGFRIEIFFGSDDVDEADMVGVLGGEAFAGEEVATANAFSATESSGSITRDQENPYSQE